MNIIIDSRINIMVSFCNFKSLIFKMIFKFSIYQWPNKRLVELIILDIILELIIHLI